MMPRRLVLVFVHGWGVTSKRTYGSLPETLNIAAASAGIEIDSRHIFLGRYISFHDEVTLDDIARAMQYAVEHDLKDHSEFACITHSTGGPIVRRWIDLFYGPKHLKRCPLRQLIMLAPANHGSALAIIGKSRIGRIKSWFEGIEPGQGVLNWLCLGSAEAWELQQRFLDYELEGADFYPFVMSGETIDSKFYDFLNQYLVEKGSDGVVRLASANLNYTFFRLEQTDDRYADNNSFILRRAPRKKTRPLPIPFGVVPQASHSGHDLGIMTSVSPGRAKKKPVVEEIIRCLKVTRWGQYLQRIDDLQQMTDRTQAENSAQYQGRLTRLVMFIFRIRDHEGRVIDDYDLFLLGDDFSPDKLPRGFYVDHQKNPRSHALTYYMDYDALSTAHDLGIRVRARPSFGRPGETPDAFAGYMQSEFRFTTRQLKQLVRPNETVYVDITLKRYVDRETLRLDPLSQGKRSFKDVEPEGPID